MGRRPRHPVSAQGPEPWARAPGSGLQPAQGNGRRQELAGHQAEGGVAMILHPELIVRLLEEEQGNVSAVARRLSCAPATVRYWRRVAIEGGLPAPRGRTPQAAQG